MYIKNKGFSSKTFTISSDKADSQNSSDLAVGFGETVNLTGFTAITKLTIAYNGGGDLNSFILDDIFMTNVGVDTTAPVFENTTPSASSITSTSFTLDTDINEAGKVYYVVVADGATPPSVSDVRAGTASDLAAAIKSGNATVSGAWFTNAFSITGLTASTAYQVHVVAEDDEGTPNVQAAVTTVSVSTPAAPVITSPESVTGDEDTFIAINVITVSDADSTTATVKLSVENGTLSLATTTGLTFSSGSNDSKSFTITGLITDINTALAGLTYQGDLNFNGTDQLSIFVSDKGNSGTGEVLTDAESVTINVNAVNDAPVINNSDYSLGKIDKGEISASIPISQILLGLASDPDSANSDTSLSGIAIIDAPTGYGRWQFSTD